MRFFDAHGHMHSPVFDADRGMVIERARAKGVVAHIAVGTQLQTSRAAVELAHKYPKEVFASIGLHPSYANPSHFDKNDLPETSEGHRTAECGESFDYFEYVKLANDMAVVAVGECGLDYHYLSGEARAEKEKQREVLVAQLQFAHEMKKPLMIHCREAARDFCEITHYYRNILPPTNPGIMHFYTDGIDEAKKLLDLGFYFTFGGVVTFTRQYDELARLVPEDRILIETDCPYVAPLPHRGRRNEPSFLPYTYEALAVIRKISIDDLSVSVEKNFHSIFNV